MIRSHPRSGEGGRGAGCASYGFHSSRRDAVARAAQRPDENVRSTPRAAARHGLAVLMRPCPRARTYVGTLRDRDRGALYEDAPRPVGHIAVIGRGYARARPHVSPWQLAAGGAQIPDAYIVHTHGTASERPRGRSASPPVSPPGWVARSPSARPRRGRTDTHWVQQPAACGARGWKWGRGRNGGESSNADVSQLRPRARQHGHGHGGWAVEARPTTARARRGLREARASAQSRRRARFASSEAQTLLTSEARTSLPPVPLRGQPPREFRTRLGGGPARAAHHE